MKSFIDDALVGVLLVVSAAYVFWALGPRGLRRIVLGSLGMWLGRAPAAFGLGAIGMRMRAAAEARVSGTCGGCDNCGPALPKADAAASSAGETRVLLTSIPRSRRQRSVAVDRRGVSDS